VAAANVVAKFTADISDVQAKMAALKQSFQQAGDSTEALSQRMVMLGNTVSDVGKKMTLGITAPLAALGVVAINTQKDFEVSMNTLGVVSGAAANEVQQLGAYAMQMGADTVYSAGEAANAMVDLAKSGFTPAQITGGGLAATMALAATEGMALSDAAVTVANAMATFGLEADQASLIADALAGGANASTASVESLTSALRQVGPGAVNAGLSLQETVATLAAFDAAGIKGSDAGTSLKTMLMRLVPSTNEAATAMQELGLNFTNADGSFKSITEIAAILQRQLGGLTEAQKVQALTTVFGADATRAATVLMNEGANGIQTYIDGTNQLGAAQELANARMSGTAGTLEQLKGSLETAALVVGENLAPTFQVLANAIKTITDAFLTLPKPMQQLIVGAGAIAAALGPILWVSGKVMASFTMLATRTEGTRTRMVASFRQIGTSATTMAAQVRAAMAASTTTMGGMAAGARVAGAGVAGAFRTMGAAAKGFLASIGPIGWALAGAAIAFEAFGASSRATEQIVGELKDQVDLTRQSLTDMGVEAVAAQLMEAFGPENIAALEDYGISMAELVDGVVSGGQAFDDIRSRMVEFRNSDWWYTHRMGASDLIAQLDITRNAVSQTIEAGNQAAAAREISANRAATAESAMTSATVQSAIAAGNAIGPTQALAGAVNTVTDAAGNAVTQLDFMKQEYDSWLVTTGQISAVDAAAEAIDNLGAASVEFGSNLMGQTPKARDFRAAVVDAFEQSAQAAQSLSDDIPTQRAIFTGELIKIVASLRASGIKPKDIEAFLGSMEDLPASVSDIMRSAAKAVGDTNFKTEVEKAFDKSVKAGAPMTADAMERLATGASNAAKEQLGLTLEPQLAGIIKSGTTALRPTAFNNGQLTGKSIGSGLANGIQASSPIVQAAVARVIAQAKAAADAAAESQSPSRLFARTGDDMVRGVAMGWLRMSPTLIRAITSIIPKAKGESRKLAKGMAEAFATSLRESGGSVAAAINEIFGSIPTKTPLEAQLGVKGAEKFIKDNKQALAALLELGQAIDRINEKVQYAGEAFTSLGALVARPFGRQSQISEMFGSEADIDSVIDGFLTLQSQVKQAYSVLTDASIVGAKAAARNRKEMQATIGELRKLTQQAVQLREQYDTVMQELETLEQDYQKSIADTNAFYDAAEKKAEENIKAIEDRWAAAIPGLEAALKNATAAFDKENAVLQRLITQRDEFVGQIKSGFRSFVNSLTFQSRSASKQIVRETKRLADGITVTLERELEVGGGPAAIRQTLEERLAAVRDFSRNIKTLMQRGLDPSLVQDFVSAGVSGAGEAAAALAAGSQEDITAINSVQTQLLSEAENFGKYASAQWHDAAIAQQQAIVTPLEVARDAAQKALDDANALRDKELAAARAQLDKLRTERQAALTLIDTEYNKKKSELETKAADLQAQMDAVAAQIEEKILTMLNTTATRSAEAGVKAGEKLLEGFQKKYPAVYKKLNTLMDQLAASLTRTATVTVQTVYQAVMPVTPPPAAKIPKRAMGGPVAARTAYLVGERGPELFVPGFNGNIIPNNQLGTVPAMGARGGGAAGTVINVTVNAGMGTNGDDVGRQIVDSLRRYERRNGPIPVKVTG